MREEEGKIVESGIKSSESGVKRPGLPLRKRKGCLFSC